LVSSIQNQHSNDYQAILNQLDELVKQIGSRTDELKLSLLEQNEQNQKDRNRVRTDIRNQNEQIK
jgi:hypothetical protein